MAIDLIKSGHVVYIDVKTCEISDNFWAKQGDTGRSFLVKLVNDGQIITPTTEIVKLYIYKPDGNSVWITGTIGDGGFYVTLTNQALAVDGDLKCEFEITSNSKVKKTETFIIKVQRNIYENAYQSVSQLGALDLLIQKIEVNAPKIDGWVSAEATRVSNENTRKSNETARVTAETGRVNAESSRVTAETARVTAENTRVSQENTRKTQETARVTAETARANAEGNSTKGRVKAENDRVTAETGRVDAETARVTAETGRVTAETARVTAENTRVSQENTRKTQETARINAEGDSTKGRVKAENDRVTAESSRVTAETARVTAENARVTAENARKSAETGRANAETTRMTNENTRVSQETTRQTNTSNALTRMDNAYNSTIMIYKASVPNYSSIATTYPNPQVGWRVETEDTRKIYRYSGTGWVHISNASLTEDVERTLNKGVANGYVPLDSTAKIQHVYLPTIINIGTSQPSNTSEWWYQLISG